MLSEDSKVTDSASRSVPTRRIFRSTVPPSVIAAGLVTSNSKLTSSSRIVPVALVMLPSTPPVGAGSASSATLKVSSASISVSPSTSTVMACSFSPSAAKVMVPRVVLPEFVPSGR